MNRHAATRLVMLAGACGALIRPGANAGAEELNVLEAQVGIKDVRKAYKVSGDVLVGQLESGQARNHDDLPIGQYTFQGSGEKTDHATAVSSIWLANRAASGNDPALIGLLSPSRTGEPQNMPGAKVKSAWNKGSTWKEVSDNNLVGLDWLHANTAAEVFNFSNNFYALDPDDAGGSGIDANRNPTRILDYFAWQNHTSTYIVASGNYSTKQANRPNDQNVDHILTPAGDGYNVITVGATDGSHRVENYSLRGPTDDGNRRKPDLVAPGSKIRLLTGTDATKEWTGTSFATPMVTAGVALMQEYAEDNGGGDRANHRAIKSVLQTTAFKDIKTAPGGTNVKLLEWQVSHTRNDLHVEAGAGQISMGNAMSLYKEKEHTPTNPGADLKHVATGWHVDAVGPGQGQTRNNLQGVGKLTTDDVLIATLVWDRPMTRDTKNTPNNPNDDTFAEPTGNSAKFQDLELYFETADGSAEIDKSNRSRDTVEHLVVKPKTNGEHRLRVENRTNTRLEDYALSWRIYPRPQAPRPRVKPTGTGSSLGGSFPTVQPNASNLLGGSGDPHLRDDVIIEPDGNEPTDDMPDARPRRPQAVPESHAPRAWSNGFNDLWSLATPGAGGRLFFSVDADATGMAPSYPDDGDPVLNEVWQQAQLGQGFDPAEPFVAQNTYFTSILERPDSISPVQPANGINANHLDWATEHVRSDMPSEITDITVDFDGIDAMEWFGVRVEMLAQDRDADQLANLSSTMFFTIDQESDLFGAYGLGDILMLRGGEIMRYAAAADLGLDGSTIIDGLIVDDDGLLVGDWPVYDSTDRLLFSVESDIMGADLFLASLGMPTTTLVMADAMGLLPTDNIIGLDVLDHVPGPGTGALLLLTGALVRRRRA